MGIAAQRHWRHDGEPSLTFVWFPHPDSPADLQLLAGSGSLSAPRAFSLMTAESANEWRDKVGIAGPLDGSAKHTTRLLESDGWVIKTNVDDEKADPEQVSAMLDDAIALSRRVRLWHPSKHWFCLRSGDSFYPVTVCRRLVTLRQLGSRDLRMVHWTQMIELAIWIELERNVGLDINPSNFGLDADFSAGINRPFYLDDELYPPGGPMTIGEAIAARIPEETSASATEWYAWGKRLQPVLATLCETAALWEALLDGLGGYPLAARYHDNRDALEGGLREGHPLLDRRARSRSAPSRLTCVFADVHANAFALDSVLNEARRLGATDFVFLGDAVGYGPHPKQCVERLAEIDNLVSVRGNHDHAVATGDLEVGMNRLARETAAWTRDQLGESELSWLLSLPLEHTDRTWMALHGAPMDPRKFLAYVYELTYQDNLEALDKLGRRLCFYGHTHVQFTHRQVAGRRGERVGARPIEVLRPDEVLLVNPGSVGQPRDGDPRAGFLLWDQGTNSVSFHRVEYAVARTVDALKGADLPVDLVYRLEMGR